MNYEIFVESSCDLSKEMLESLGLKLVSLNVVINGVAIKNENLALADFYKKLRSGVQISTTAANPNDYREAFEPWLKKGKDILLVGFSSSLSSSVLNAQIAANELMEEYPQSKVIAVDSLCASMGQGLLAAKASQNRKQGMGLEENAEHLKSIIPNLVHSFTVSDLNFLKRGGRISAATALVGTVLGIKPLLYMNNEGKLLTCGKVRGRKASIKALADNLFNYAQTPKEQEVYISHVDCLDDAKELAGMIKNSRIILPRTR